MMARRMHDPVVVHVQVQYIYTQLHRGQKWWPGPCRAWQLLFPKQLMDATITRLACVISEGDHLRIPAADVGPKAVDPCEDAGAAGKLIPVAPVQNGHMKSIEKFWSHDVGTKSSASFENKHSQEWGERHEDCNRAHAWLDSAASLP